MDRSSIRATGLRPTRRASVYVLALGASTLVTIAGLSVIAVTRAQGRAADAERDSAEAGIHARSGIEIAAASANSVPNWRTIYRHGAPVGPISIGRGNVTLFFADPADADLSNDPTEPIVVTAVARVGGATRALTARLVPVGDTALEALRAAAVAGGSVTVSGPGPVAASAVFSNSGVGVGAPFTGDIQASSVTSSSFINGRVTTGVPAKTLPGSAALNALAPLATAIDYNAISGKIDNTLLTPASNAAGPSNPRGVYAITVPANKTLEIKRSRLQATLLITLNTDSEVIIRNELLWEPGSPDLPAMIVSGASSKGVKFDLSGNELAEGGAKGNLNPPGSPYNGSSNTNQSDKYPCVCRGIFQVLSASTPTTVQTDSAIVGSLIVAGPLTLAGRATLAADPALLASPPSGYRRTSNITMQVEPGSYRWVVDSAAP